MASTTTHRPSRGAFALFGERVIESLVYLCGISAIVFVFGIFFFVFKEGAPFLSKLNFTEFFTSKEWIPTSSVQPKYGIGALIVGTLSVTFLAMAIAVPFGLGAAQILLFVHVPFPFGQAAHGPCAQLHHRRRAGALSPHAGL